MPSLSTMRVNRTYALRAAVVAAWSGNADPAQRVSALLKSFPGFTFALRSALRRSARRGNKLFLDGFGLFRDEAHVLVHLTNCASRDAESFYTFFRDFRVTIDARNHALRTTSR